MNKLFIPFIVMIITISCTYCLKDFSSFYSKEDLIFRYYNENINICYEYYRNKYTTEESVLKISKHYKNLSRLYGYSEQDFDRWMTGKCPRDNIRYIGNCRHNGRSRIDLFDLGTYDYIVYSYGKDDAGVEKEIQDIAAKKEAVGYRCRFKR